MAYYTDKDCDDVDVDIEVLEQRIADLWLDVDAIDVVIDEINGDIGDAKDDRSDLQDDYLEKKTPQEEFQRQLNTANDRLGELEGEISAKETECGELETAYDEVMIALADAEAALGVKQGEYSEAEDYYEILSEIVHALGDDPDADPTDFDEAVHNLTHWIVFMEEIEADIETLTEDLANAETAYEIAERAKEDCERELEDLQDEKQKLEEETIPELEGELEDIGEIESIEDEDLALWREINRLNGEKGEWERTRQGVIDEIDPLEQDLQDLYSEWDVHCA